ncbi:zinc finger CCHC domain-containing protein 7-like [Oscarella lobularis]|uniref:zinc finger CCHC domain-containing protein 7-like n=1 Tax=Oscarella lobularis TaxID=121494 RepID=UPI003313B6C7
MDVSEASYESDAISSDLECEIYARIHYADNVDEALAALETEQSDGKPNLEPKTTAETSAGSPTIEKKPRLEWRVCDEDVDLGTETGKRKRGRYYKKAVECKICRETGHSAKQCMNKKFHRLCFLCAEEGHLARACPFQLCFRCHQPGHKANECKRRYEYSKFIQCRRCEMNGHIERVCPDLWRQFHNTTSWDELALKECSSEMRISYCYNCAKKGHVGHECPKPRMEHAFPPTLPLVACYDRIGSARPASRPSRFIEADVVESPSKKRKLYVSVADEPPSKQKKFEKVEKRKSSKKKKVEKVEKRKNGIVVKKEIVKKETVSTKRSKKSRAKKSKGRSKIYESEKYFSL